MKFISFFAGIGGLDIGLERAGFECAAQVEIDTNCRKVLRHQYPHVKRFGDVSKVDPKDFPQADLYVGGFPCQDLSTANMRRKGFEGKRSSLWHEFIRCIENRKPTFVLAENVPGLLSARNGQDMGIVVRSLENRGYSCEWRVLDSQHFGVPQRRKRLFLIATKIDRYLRGATYRPILFEQGGMSWNPDKSNKEKQTDSRLAEESSGKSDKPRVVNAYFTNHPSMREGHRVYDIDGISPPLRAGSPTQILDVFIKSKRARNKEDFEVWKRSEDFPHPTLCVFDSGPSRTVVGVVTQDYKIRRFTPMEVERLQGFPDNWTAKGIDENGKVVDMAMSARYRQAGNAVTVNVAEWIGKRLMKRIKEYGYEPRDR